VTRVINERSAGGVLLLPIGQALLVALICLRGGEILALPKGHIEDGESREQAAMRETREETGMAGVPLAPLRQISYVFRSRHHGARVAKRVDFFLMAYRAGSPARHDTEVDGVRLVPIERAERSLAYPGERAVMGEALAWVRAAGYGGGWAKEGPDRSP
jgi:8-oxo-dGTP pyrophosphatase MutT (NUDIX family)